MKKIKIKNKNKKWYETIKKPGKNQVNWNCIVSKHSFKKGVHFVEIYKDYSNVKKNI